MFDEGLHPTDRSRINNAAGAEQGDPLGAGKAANPPSTALSAIVTKGGWRGRRSARRSAVEVDEDEYASEEADDEGLQSHEEYHGAGEAFDIGDDDDRLVD